MSADFSQLPPCKMMVSQETFYSWSSIACCIPLRDLHECPQDDTPGIVRALCICFTLQDTGYFLAGIYTLHYECYLSISTLRRKYISPSWLSLRSLLAKPFSACIIPLYLYFYSGLCIHMCITIILQLILNCLLITTKKTLLNYNFILLLLVGIPKQKKHLAQICTPLPTISSWTEEWDFKASEFLKALWK